jgi:hypothetical protein
VWSARRQSNAFVLRREHPLPARDAPERVRHVSDPLGLLQEAVRSRSDRIEHGLVVTASGEHEDADGQALGADVPGDVETLHAARKPEVQDDDVRPELEARVDGRLPVDAFTHDLESVRDLARESDDAADHGVVLDDEYPGHG